MSAYKMMTRMKRMAMKALGIALLVAMLLPSVALADDVQTLAILKYGRYSALDLFDAAVLDMLEVYGYIDAEERAELEAGNDLRGEKINILNRNAESDMPTANLMVEDVLDEGADVLLTVSNQIGHLAATAIGELEDPPVMIFAIVTAPDAVGIVESTCVKPANITGAQMYIDWEFFESMYSVQNPDFARLGAIVDSSDPASEWFAKGVQGYAERHGFSLEIETVVTAADWQLAAETLVSKGVEAIIIQPRTGEPSAGIPGAVTAAHGVPVYSVIVSDVFEGVTIGVGYDGWYNDGVIAARMLIGHMRHEIDVGRTGVATRPALAIAVNLDSAALQEVEISEEMMAVADFVLEGGEGLGMEIEVPGVTTVLEEMTLEERMAEDAAFLAGLQCTEEMIAEQKAALEAAGDE